MVAPLGAGLLLHASLRQVGEGRGVRVRMSPVQTEKGHRQNEGIRAGGLVGGGKRNGKESKTPRPDPKGQLRVGRGASLGLLGQWEPGRGLEQEVGARCREMKQAGGSRWMGRDSRPVGKGYKSLGQEALPGLELLQCEGEEKGGGRREPGPRWAPSLVARSCRPSLRGSDSPWRHRAFNLCPCLLGRKLLRSMDFDIFLCLAAYPLARGRPSRDMHGMRK